MSAGIFISYRRGDSRHAAGRLSDDLAQAFGADSIFRDIETIDLGVRFADALERALSSCRVMLVLIGPQWLDIRDESGVRRLDQPGDWVRQEVASALARGIPVVPVLLEGARLPRPDELPAVLATLVERQKVELSDERWRGDINSLIERLARLPGLARADGVSAGGTTTSTPPRAWKRWAWGLGALLLVAGWYEQGGGGPSPGPEADPRAVADALAAVAQAASQAVPAAGTRAPEVPAAAPVSQVGGLWRSLSGEVYEFSQTGRQLQVAARMQGMVVARGEGEVDPGGLLRLSLAVQAGGVNTSAACNLQLAPDGASMMGQCLGPQGAYAAQMFR